MNRKQCCYLNRVQSSIGGVEFGVPQGSFLGSVNIRELIRYDTAVMMHKIKYGSSSYLREMFHTTAEVHDKPLKNSEIDFRCKRMSTDASQRSFSFI